MYVKLRTNLYEIPTLKLYDSCNCVNLELKCSDSNSWYIFRVDQNWLEVFRASKASLKTTKLSNFYDVYIILFVIDWYEKYGFLAWRKPEILCQKPTTIRLIL